MANEKRLIDANALIAKAHEEMFAYEAEQFKEWVENFPTVDAAEVVRCKDCKHYVRYWEDCEERRCEVFSGCYDRPYPTEPDDFCSYGERKNYVE